MALIDLDSGQPAGRGRIVDLDKGDTEKASVLDYGRALMSGFAGIPEAAGKGIRYVGAESAGKWLQELGHDSAQSWIGWMTPAGQRAMQNEIFTDDLKAGATPWQSLGLQAAMSIPSMIATIPIGGPIAGGIAKIGGPALAKLAASPGAAGFIARVLPTSVGYGAAEGGIAALQNAAQTESEILETPFEKLQQHPNFQRLFDQTDASLPEAERLKLAREATARLASDEVAWKTFVSTGGIGALTGGGAMGGAHRAIQKGGAGLIKQTLKGAGEELIQEAPQSGMEKYIENVAMQKHVDPTLDTSKGVISAAASGGAVGAVTGAVTGAGGHIIEGVSRREPDPVETITTARTVDEAIAAAHAATAPGAQPAPRRAPWEMTRQEFEADAAYQGGNAATDESNPSYWFTDQPGEARTFAEGQRGDGAPARTQPRIDVASRSDLGAEWKDSERPTGSKHAYTGDRKHRPIIATIPLEAANDPHRHLVEKALSEGKTVPEAVLAQYPDLAARTRPFQSAADTGVTQTPTGIINPALAENGVVDLDAATRSTVDARAHEAATSPTNDRSDPTKGQAQAGNYLMGHIRVGPTRSSVENPAGSVREDKENTPPKWRQEVTAHYGYFVGVPARAPDKERVDNFTKPGTPEDHDGPAFVVDQNKPDGSFDEPKVMVGYGSRSEAERAYLSNYETGWEKRVRGVTAVPSMVELHRMLQNPNAFMQPQAGSQPISVAAAQMPDSARTGASPETASTPDRAGTITNSAPAAAPAVEHYQWKRNAQGGQTFGNRQTIQPITRELFDKYIKPRIKTSLRDFDAWRGANPGDTHISLVEREDGKIVPGDGFVGTPEKLRPQGEALKKGLARQVPSFDDIEGRRHGATADEDATVLGRKASELSEKDLQSAAKYASAAVRKGIENELAARRRGAGTAASPKPSVMLLGRPIDKLSDDALAFAAKSGSEDVKKAATAEINARNRAKQAGVARQRQVHPEVDSLFAAIGKLGGINKDKAIAEWGIDPKDRPQSGVIGMPVWRVEGGFSLDEMGKMLAEKGYLETGPDGKIELTDFEAAFDKELRGEPVMAAQGYERQAARRQADLEEQAQAEAERGAAAIEAEVGDAWAIMTDEDKDAELDKIFGSDSREGEVPATGPEAGASARPHDAGQEVPGEGAVGGQGDTAPIGDGVRSDRGVRGTADSAGNVGEGQRNIQGPSQTARVGDVGNQRPEKLQPDAAQRSEGVGQPDLFSTPPPAQPAPAKAPADAGVSFSDTPDFKTTFPRPAAESAYAADGDDPVAIQAMHEEIAKDVRSYVSVANYIDFVLNQGKWQGKPLTDAKRDELAAEMATAQQKASDLTMEYEQAFGDKAAAAFLGPLVIESNGIGKKRFEGENGPVTDQEPDVSAIPGEVERPQAPEPKPTASIVAPARSKRTPSPAKGIADVGENLWYNRRNFTGKALAWDDVRNLNETLKVKEVVKPKVWPRPNYEQLVADGLQPFFAHFIKKVYDGIAVAPNGKSDDSLQRYITVVGRIRDAAFDWAKDNNANREFMDAVVDRAKAMTQRGPISVTSMIAPTGATDIRTVMLKRVWPDYPTERGMKSGVFFREGEPAKEIMVAGGNRALQALQFSTDDAVKAMKDIEKGWPKPQEAWQKQGYRVMQRSALEARPSGVKDGVALYIDGRYVYGIDPKPGDTVDSMFPPEAQWFVFDKGRRLVGWKETEESAKDIAREATKRESKGADLRGMNIAEAERTGPARRVENDDVSADRLMKEFGFRGVNFGREGWINQGERQAYLNHAYDGLLDLAEILDVPPKSLSLNGMLGIAFGAQGRGGQAAAHFVPGVNEINLTKTQGAGTLAHEWGHALDHYFATKGGLSKNESPFLSEHVNLSDAEGYTKREGKKVKAFGEDLRAEIVARIKEIVDAMEKRAMTPEEVKARSEGNKSRALRSLDGWLKVWRSKLHKTTNQERSEAEFDQLADRMRRGDLGDGYVKTGKLEVRPVVAQMRNLVKDATGYMPTPDDTRSLDSNAGFMRIVLSEQTADAEHVPQTTTTDYKRESTRKDHDKGGKQYWSSGREMFARAFESYVADRLEDLSRTNTFLSSAALRREAKDGQGAYLQPYPRQQDRIATNTAFDKLVETMETETTDRGVGLFSRSGTGSPAFVKHVTKSGLTTFGNGEILLANPRRFPQDPAERAVMYAVMDTALVRKGRADGKNETLEASVGAVELDVTPDGTITGLSAIIIQPEFRTPRRKNQGLETLGYGEKVIRAILATLPEDARLNIYGILPEARPFWEKMGVEYVQSERGGLDDGIITRTSYERTRGEIGGRSSGLVFSSREGRTDAAEGPAAAERDARTDRQSRPDEIGRDTPTEAPPSAGLSLSTVESVRAELGAEVGDKAAIVNVVQSWHQLPLSGRQLVLTDEAYDIQGYFEIATGKMWLLADNIDPGTAFSVLMHEGGVHKGLTGMIGNEGVSRLANQVKAWSMGSGKEDHFRLAKIAAARIPEDTPGRFVDQEYVAYFVEEAVRAGHGVSDAAGPIARFFRQLLEFIRAAALKLGLTPAKMTTADIVALARGALEHALAGGDVAPIGGSMASRGPSINRQLQLHGEEVSSLMDAERRLAAGERIFVFHEQDEQPEEIRSVDRLRGGATYDQIMALPAAVGETNSGGTVSRPAIAGGMASRRGATASLPLNERERTTKKAQDFVRDLITSDRRFGFWHRTVGTQQHKALTNAEFKPVYDESQRFINDISRYANEPADLANDLLPRIEGFKDFFKKAPSKADVNAVGTVLMQGTLFGGGSPMDGRVWTNAELRSGRLEGKNLQVFEPLNDKQINLYRQALSAVNHSLDEFGKSMVYRYARVHDIPVNRDMELPDMVAEVTDAFDSALEQARDRHDNLADLVEEAEIDVDRPYDRTVPAERAEHNAAVTKRDQVAAQRDAAAKEVEEITAARAAIEDVKTKVTDLQKHGYFPAMRFGQFAVYVTRPVRGSEKPEQLHFSLYDTQREANAAARELAAQYPDADITKGMISQERHKLFQGLSLDALETFAEHMDIDADPIVQGFLRAATSQRSTLKRQIHRSGLAGFTDDIPRALASFVVSTARTTSSNYHSANMLAAANDIKAGDVQDEAVKLVRYLMDPAEEASTLRAYLFLHFIGGSIAHGIVNLTQPIMVTAPYLSQHASYTKVLEQLGRAMKEVSRGAPLPAGLKDAVDRAKQEGVVAPQEIHQLRAEAGPALVGKSLLVRKLTHVWGSIYSVTEQFNRATTFIAAYRIGQDKKVADPYQFAVDTVNETQFVYNKGSRPNWARGPVGATVMTFKQFSISYLELMKRLYDKDKKAFAIMLLTLLAAAGAEGLPFAEDIEDIIDTVGQWMGYATNSKKALRRFATDMLGRDLANFALHGVSAGLPVDVSVRLGLQNLIPGTSMLNPSAKNKGRDVAELLGPIGQFIPVEGTAVGSAIERLTKGDIFGAAKAGAPVSIKNFLTGYEMAETGEARDSRGKKIIETTPSDAFAKMVGLQPARVAESSRRIGEVATDIDMQRTKEAEIAEKWARGIHDKRPEVVEEARQELKDWNDKNPELRIVIKPQQIQSRVRDFKRTRDERFVKHAPPELRSDVRDRLRQP